MTRDAVPYVWSPETRSLEVAAPRSPSRLQVLAGQRRRFAHPIVPPKSSDRFECTFDFTFEDFGRADDPDAVIGLFRSDRSIEESSLTLRVSGRRSLRVERTIAGGRLAPFPAINIEAGRSYRAMFACDLRSRKLTASISFLGAETPLVEGTVSIPADSGESPFNEIGVGLWDGGPPTNTSGPSYRYRLKWVEYRLMSFVF